MPERPIRRLAALLLSAISMLAAAAHAATFIVINSEPGDYVGGGVNRTLTTADGVIAADRTTAWNNGIHVGFTLPSGYAQWNLYFSGPDRTVVTPGVYEYAERHPVETAGHPGLDVSGDGRGCNQEMGRFVVHEVTYAADGSVLAFAADFEQYCEFRTRAAYGAVRINSAVPYSGALPVRIPITVQAHTYGPHFLGPNRDILLTNNTGWFAARAGNGLVDLLYDGGGSSWFFRFMPKAGLVPGTYQVTGASSDSMMFITGEGTGCNDRGKFTVHEIEYSPYGYPTRFAIDVEDTCPEFPGSALHAGIRYNSTVPYFAPPPPPSEVATTLAYVGPIHSVTIPRNGYVAGFQVLTVNASGQPVGAQLVRFSATCGSFIGYPGSVDAYSSASGIADVPSWTIAIPATCRIIAELLASSHPTLDFVITTTDTATGVAFVDGTSTYTVAPGTTSTLRVATVNEFGARVPSQDVSAFASCGSFSGATAPAVNVVSGPDGIATLPAWVAPSGPTSCAIDVRLSTAPPPGAITFTMQVAAISPPPPPPNPPPQRSATGTAPGGGSITLTLASNVAECTLTRASFIDPATISPPVAPLPDVANLAMPHGYVDFRADNCGSGQSITVNVDLAQDLPPTAQYWKYGPTADNRARHWYVIPSTVSGKRISFSITDGGLGDDDLTMNGSISDLGMVAIPGGMMQDLWWSGLAENGWGMTIVQHRDVLFGNMFVYDANGVATWYVMPSGSWDSAHKVYTGDLFLPKGSPYFAYDVSKFDIGAPVGTARITFNGVNEATFEYTINGVSARKNISRIPFGPVAPPTDKPLGDLWWAGLAQNGWGLVLTQQYATLFGLWFTYDANGKATWFVMPNVEIVSKDIYRGNIYRPEGPPWLGVTYDPSRHRTVQVGTFTLRFSGDGATFDYSIDGKSGSIPISRIPF